LDVSFLYEFIETLYIFWVTEKPSVLFCDTPFSWIMSKGIFNDYMHKGFCHKGIGS